MEKVLLWGTGEFARKYETEIRSRFESDEFCLLGFVDNNPEKKGSNLYGYRIYGPEEIEKLDFDRIVITASKEKYRIIRNQILTNSEINVSKEKVNSFTWLLIDPCPMSESISERRRYVFDCFPFFNELDVIEFRFALLENYVDYFVLVEIDKTHRWVDKPLYFKKNKKRYEKYLDKIIYVNPKELPERPENVKHNRAMENFQRNCILMGLEGCAEAEDLIMISDADEIPNPKTIEMMKKNTWLLEGDIYSFEQKFFNYYLNYCHKTKWNGTYISKYKNLGRPQKWRSICGFLPEINDGGWHLSYFGGNEMIEKKSDSIIKDEDANIDVSKDEIEDRVKRGVDLYGRTGEEFDLEYVNVKNIGIPGIDRIKEKFPHFFLDKE